MTTTNETKTKTRQRALARPGVRGWVGRGRGAAALVDPAPEFPSFPARCVEPMKKGRCGTGPKLADIFLPWANAGLLIASSGVRGHERL